MTHRTPCRRCQRPIGNHVLTAHERACKKHPGDDMLLKDFDRDGMSIRGLARKHKVSRGTITTWLGDAGAKGAVPKEYKRPPPPDAFWELSILEPCHGGCHRRECFWLPVCRTRVSNNLPLLSEAPIERELETWTRAGWIPGDWKGERLRNG